MENKSIKVLLVEDNPNDTELMGVMLKKAAISQFELVVVKQLGQALQQLEDERFDVILLDLVLPDGQGLDTFNRICAQAPDVPIILLTGLDDEALAIQTVQAGAQDYLVKGQMESHLLVRAIRHAVERQQLRLELKASEARLCAIIENNADGIVVVNRAGIVQFVNPSAEALFGRSTDEFVGKPFDFLITPTETSELNLVCNDGQTATVEMRVVETAWSGESAYLASLRDITARKRAEEALRHEKEFSERLIHSSVDGILAFDRECRYTVWNPGMECISGVGKEDALGNLAFEVFPFLKEIGEDKFFFEALAGRTVVAENRPYIIPETGRQGFFEGYYSPLRRESGEIIGGLAIIRDITERTQVEKTLQDNLQQLEIAYEQATIYAQELIQEIIERKLADKALRDAYDELEMRVLERTMDLSRANEALQNEIKEREQMEDLLRVQRDLGLAISIGPGLDETLRLCVEAAIRVSPGMDCGGIYLVDEDTGDLELVFHQGFPADYIKSVSHYAADSANAHLVTAGKPIYTRYRDLGISLDDPGRREGLRAIAIIPVRHQDRVVACLNIASHTTDEVSEFVRTALETIVTQIGGAIAHARAVEALWESEERYALAARGANDGLWDWDLQTNQVYFSARWKSMLGYEENEIGHSPDEWFDRVHPEDIEQIEAAITAHCEGRLSHLEHEHRMLHRDGVYRWMLSRGLAVRDATGQVYRMAGSQTDITERKQTEAKLMHDAFYDSLTELPNRTFFIDRVSRAIRQTKEDENHLFAVFFLDLDRFKVVNDSLGHLIGDELLIAVAMRLSMCLDNSDVIARLGGDEFAILLNGIEDLNEARQVANRIQKQMVLPFEVSDQMVFTTVSIGITPSTIGYDQPEECLRDADTAMYQAKANGRARYEIFRRDMHANALSLWQLDADLRRAVARQEFEVYYQPIVSLASGQISGAEALLRWKHPQRGLLDPAEFLSLAEETGLIMPMGEWVLRQACVHNKAWQANGGSPLSVAINLCARQFQHQDLPNLIKEVLHETDLMPQALVLEITESVATKNIDPSLATLHELSAMGIKISIDDFGIGSALDCLKRFPLNNLKIDQSFVRDIISDKHNAAITRAIIDIAHSLDLTVIAEGVETEEQLAFLRSYQCDQIQGYLFSRPMPAEAFTKLLQQGWQLTIDRDMRSN